MKISFQKNKFSLYVSVCLIYLFSLMCQPLAADGATLIYTIQSGSFKDMEKALKQYDSIIEVLDKEDLDYLRVEKIGVYYSVRLGRFDTHKKAEKFYQSIIHRLPSIILISAYIKDKRIRKLYSHIPSDEERKKVSPPPVRQNEISRPVVSDAKKRTEIPAAHHDKNGTMHVKDRRLLSAAEEYKQAITKDPDNPVLYFKLARVLSDLGLVDEAIDNMKKAIDLSSAVDSGFRGELGKIYLSRNMPDKAKEQFLATLKTQPGLGDIHYYLGVVFMKEENYNMAWLAARTAKSLGYKRQDLINILSLLSKEPSDLTWHESGDVMYIRHIVAETREEAEGTLHRISEGEHVDSFIGSIKPAEVHPKIVDALRAQKAFAGTVIVETEHGYHIIQRIVPFYVYSQNNNSVSEAQETE
jgi:tetratricopeptide (TPR) repeat protein